MNNNNMNNNNQNNNDSKKITSLLILIATLMIVTTGSTYAYFAISASNDNTITGTAASVDLNLAVSRVTPDSTKWSSSTQVMVPQLNTALSSAMNATNKCVDGNSNVVCEVFEITITNNSTSSLRLRGALFFTYTGTDATYSNLYWRQTTNANTMGSNTIFKASTSETTNSSTANSENATLVADLLLTPASTANASQTYYVVVWIEETNTTQNAIDRGTWTATVSFKDKVNPGKGVTSTITS